MIEQDAETRLATTIARVAAWSQPFYPLYIYFAAGTLAWPAFLSLLSTPFFGAVPWLARRNPAGAKALLVMTGVINTTLCMVAMGETSLVFAYLAPILLLAVLIFPVKDWWNLALLLAATIAIATSGHLAARAITPGFTLEQSRSLALMHLASAAALTALILFLHRRGKPPATAAPPPR